jgi:uncharacterized membrane protein YphA (DoxX/SURF4 family)
MSTVQLALRLALAALFVWAGAAKLADPVAFSEEIANYRLAATLAPLLAATLPSIEIVAGLALAFGPPRWRAGAALLVLALLITFTIAVSTAWLRRIDVHCGCFGKGGGIVDGLTVLRDLALVACAALVLHATARA